MRRKVSTVRTEQRPQLRYYMYELISDKNYRLLGGIVAADAYDAYALWYGTKVKNARWRKMKSRGITTLKMVKVGRKIPCEKIRPHFTFTYIGW